MGITVALVLFSKIGFDLSYNSFYPDSENIYIIYSNIEQKKEESQIAPYPQVSGGIAIGFKTDIPEVETATRFTYLYRGTFYNESKNKFKGSFIIGDSSLFDVVPRPMVAGNAKEVLSKPMYALVSQSIANKMGNNVIGEQIELDNKPGKKITIGGIFEDIPQNAHHRYDIIVSMPSINQFTWDGSNNWFGNDRYIAYVKLKKGTNPNTLTSTIRQLQEKYQDIQNIEKQYNVNLTYKLSKLTDSTTYYPSVKRSILILSLLAVVALFVSVMNYMLFVISGLIDKSKKVAIHKTYGASSKDILNLSISETLVDFFVSLILSSLFILIFQGAIKSILNVSIVDLFNWETASILGIGLVILSIITALIPSYILSSIPVISTIRSLQKNRKTWKLVLLLIQFIGSVFLVTFLSIVTLQYKKMISADHGFQYEKLVYTNTNKSDNKSVVQKIKQLSFVENISTCSALPLATGGPSGNNVSVPNTNEELFNIADFYWVDENFIPTMNIKLLDGSNFTSESAINEILVSKLFDQKMRNYGWTEGVVGKDVAISEHGICRIVGVYDDFAITSLNNSFEKPSAIFYNPSKGNLIVIKLQQINKDNILKLQNAFNSILPEKHIELINYSDSFIKQYDTENKFKNSLIIIGIIILLINMIGLLGYLKNEIFRRSSEIAVRKINGATLSDIIKMFMLDILKLIIPALLLGSIITYFIADKWMESFATKIELNPIIFLVTSVILTILIQLVVFFNCLKIANQNPVESLKSE